MKPNDLIVYTENGLFLADKQELFNMKLNTKFTGWYCSSILNFITVNNIGTLSSPICLNFILSHDVYNSKIPINKPNDLMCLSWSSCSCDADIDLPKAINYEVCEDMLNEIFTIVPDDLQRYTSGKIIGMTNYDYAVKNKIDIHFNLGKKCNFNCSYCPSYIHDNFSPFYSKNQILTAYKRIKESINLDDKEKVITLTGGEPTLQKEIVELCSEFIKMKCNITLLTNGTASIKKYEQLLDLGVCVEITFHPEFTTKKIITKSDTLKKKYGSLIRLKSMSYNNDNYKNFIEQNMLYHEDVAHRVILTRDENRYKESSNIPSSGQSTLKLL